MATSEKKCAICSHLFSDDSLECPMCGCSVFEAQRTSQEMQSQGHEDVNREIINTDPLPSKDANVKRHWFRRMFGGKRETSGSSQNRLADVNRSQEGECIKEDTVSRYCDKAIELVKDYGLAGFISHASSNTLANEILSLKNNRDRNLATMLIALHEKNLKRYIETINESEAFIKMQRECINLLIGIEAALYFMSKIKT